MLRLLAR